MAKKHRLHSMLLASAALAAVTSTANAQDKKTDQSVVDEVVVTATRIEREGFTAPTPVTQLTRDDVQLMGRENLADSLAAIPSVRQSQTSTSNAVGAGRPGFNTSDLRGLGAVRTLILVDGRRPILSSTDQFNLDTIPNSLVARVDIVTGGASAAWGSDAVAGVLNIIMDNRFEGVRASYQYGADDAGLGSKNKADFAVGAAFGPEGRGHLILGGQYNDQSLIQPRTRLPETQYAFIANPAYTPTNGQPQQLLVTPLRNANTSLGGLITAGPLKGTAFNPGGVPYPFQYGQYASASLMVGGDPQSTYSYQYYGLQPKTQSRSLYSHATYDVADSLSLDASLLYSNFHSTGQLGLDANLGNIPISSQNAFLPASIRQALASSNATSFTLGRSNADMGLMYVGFKSESVQGTLGAKGKLGETWSWDGFYSYGRTTTDLTDGPQKVKTLFAQSVDSVIGPSGQPICRVALTDPSTACVPVNLFGFGAPSAAAINYFAGTPKRDETIKQQEAAVTIRGEPISTWAGPVSIAIGAEWRRLSVDQKVDALSAAGALDFFNFSPVGGVIEVREGFAETVVPLLKDAPFAQEVDFNGAVRVSDYSTSGAVTSWKVGLSDQATDEVRLRGTVSRDIRAPGIAELFTTSGLNLANVIDPSNNIQYPVRTHLGGNPNLAPEISHAYTFGVTYQPKWLEGLQLSLDWFSIKVDGYVGSVSAQNTVTGCFDGNQILCPNVIRDASGAITDVNIYSINLATASTSGLDFEGNYRLRLNEISPSWQGSLTSHLLLSYVDKMQYDDGFTKVSELSINGISPQLSVPRGNIRWKSNLTETLDFGSLKMNLRWRFLGATRYSNTLTVDKNHIPAQNYFDFGAQYKVSEQIEVYGNVVNIFDRQPPPNFNPAYYDVYGRTFNVGLRFRR